MTEATHVLLHTAEETKLYRRTFRSSGIFEGIQSLMEIARDTDGVISNTSPVLDFPAPTSSEVTSIAGITVERRKPRLSPVSSESDSDIEALFELGRPIRLL